MILPRKRYQQKKEVEFDEDEQTAQDYSIVVTNPPPNATDPDEWKTFFEQNFNEVHVTCCTVGLDNDLLVKSLVERREVLYKLQTKLPPGTSYDILNLAKLGGEIERSRRLLDQLLAKLQTGIPELVDRLVVLNAKIQGLAQQDYPASNIFLTFETESAQREILSALSVGTWHVSRNNNHKIKNKNHLFQSNKVLNVEEAAEPSSVRWQDLNETLQAKIKQMAMTTIATIGALLLVAFLIFLSRKRNALFGAAATAIANAIFPTFAKLLVAGESHATAGSTQASLYFKIALFRWVNTAVVLTILTVSTATTILFSFNDFYNILTHYLVSLWQPFTSYLTHGPKELIGNIYILFYAEIITTNVIQLADPVGHLQRHLLAPRAKTQEAMYLLMQGQQYELAERYTVSTLDKDAAHINLIIISLY